MVKRNLVMTLTSGEGSDVVISMKGIVDLSEDQRVDGHTKVNVTEINDLRNCLPSFTKQNLPTVQDLGSMQSILNLVGYQSYGNVGYSVGYTIFGTRRKKQKD